MSRFPLLLLSQLMVLRSTAATAVKDVTIPAPIIVEPSQSFDGNDGPFSSFNLSVGNPQQNVKVFIATSIWQTLAVINEGCDVGSEKNCTARRGGEFNFEKSSTWLNNTADPKNNIYSMKVDPQLGYSGNALFGFDTVSLAGTPKPTLQNQTVGGFASYDTYLGLFGINPSSSNFTGQAPIPSYLQVLRDRLLIPSLSWGYTAGNKYRDTFGSLTLGGYDKSRFILQDGSWSIGGANDLVVQVQSITWTGSDQKEGEGLLPTPITAYIDSALPYIWLPKEACILFELSFDLEWDEGSKLYLVNDSLHTTLKQRNPTVTFNLGGMTGGSTTNVNITLPYSAFDLTASFPLVQNATRYFPLKRAADPTQFAIGRTFLQEAYVIADYERRNFSVSPCRWENEAKPEIISTFSPTYNLTPATQPGSSNSTGSGSKKSTNTGAIAGGVVGGIATIAVFTFLIWFCYWKPRREQHYTTEGEKAEKVSLPDDPHATNAELGNNQTNSGLPELVGTVGGRTQGVFELPAREEVAKEMRATIDAQELPTPDTVSEATHGGFPWNERSGQSPSPLSSPGLEGTFSPMSSPSPEPNSPVPSPSMISSVGQSPSPPPVVQPQPQRVIRVPLHARNSSLS